MIIIYFIIFEGYQLKSNNKLNDIRDGDVLETNPLISNIELTETRDSDLNDDKKGLY